MMKIRAEEDVSAAVDGILADVRSRGDAALRDYTRRFDGAELKDLWVAAAEFDAAREAVDPCCLETLKEAAENIRSFHEALMAAELAEVADVFKLGGAQAVAALAFGTETVPRVDKIVGPGGVFVATAKRKVFGLVDIDMIAGPSEILVLADGETDPKWAAADLLSQAEHDVLASAPLRIMARSL